MTDHRFILLCFHHFATEDCVAHRFQRVVMIDLGEDVHDSLVIHFRRLQDCIDDRFIRKHNVVGERLLEGSLRGTDGLRAEMQCTRRFFRCSGMFCGGARMGSDIVWFDMGGEVIGSTVNTEIT